MTADIVAFLNARWDEEQAAAEAASSPYGAWELEEDQGTDERPEVSVFPERGGSVIVCQTWPHEQGRASAAHIARWDPARVLADVAMKRALLAEHAIGGRALLGDRDNPAAWRDFCETCGSGEPHEYPTWWPCRTVLLLAQPYADHPEYRGEWALGTTG